MGSPGLYSVTAKVRWQAFSQLGIAPRMIVIIRRNNTQPELLSETPSAINIIQSQQVTSLLRLDAGDVISISVFQ